MLQDVPTKQNQNPIFLKHIYITCKIMYMLDIMFLTK